MAVIIEDKDVPKNCAHCWHSYACNYYKRDYLMLEKYADYKPDNCPIHEIKTGHWVLDGYVVPICDKCGCKPWFGYVPALDDMERKFKYCPNCGSKMTRLVKHDEELCQKSTENLEHDIAWEPTFNEEDGSM